ncbi:MAG: AAA family ATPase, partial [Spirulinaceae cyanobacterium RM2_2_10]|nr:AAA family ATPase [Spirulinaceae cyanobacterium RM2_2_10]
MNFQTEFELLLRACYPLLYVPTPEEERLEAAIASVAKRTQRAVYVWDFVDGYRDNPNTAHFGRRNPLQALELPEQLPEQAPGIFLLRDFHRFLEDIAIARKLRNLARSLKSQAKNLVIVAPELAIPTELAEVLTVVDFPLPTAAEIRAEIERLLASTGQNLPEQLLDELVRSAQGLSLERIRRVLTRAIAARGHL